MPFIQKEGSSCFSFRGAPTAPTSFGPFLSFYLTKIKLWFLNISHMAVLSICRCFRSRLILSTQTHKSGGTPGGRMDRVMHSNRCLQRCSRNSKKRCLPGWHKRRNHMVFMKRCAFSTFLQTKGSESCHKTLLFFEKKSTSHLWNASVPRSDKRNIVRKSSLHSFNQLARRIR